jgi:hypothetical protein
MLHRAASNEGSDFRSHLFGDNADAGASPGQQPQLLGSLLRPADNQYGALIEIKEHWKILHVADLRKPIAAQQPELQIASREIVF